MSKTARSTSVVSPMFRIVAVLVLFLSVTVCGLQVLGVMQLIDAQDPNAVPISKPPLFVSPLLTLIAGIGLSAVLEGVARLVGAQQSGHEDNSAALVNAMMAIGELQDSLPTLIAEAIAKTPIATPVEPAVEISHVGPMDPGIEQHLARMVTLMEEMKEVTLLDDSQRKLRRQQGNQRRKAARLDEAANFIHAGNWEQADAVLTLLESLYPGDAEVLASRNQLDDARIMHQANSWDHLKPQVDELLARSKYAESLELTGQFLDRYPNHYDCQQLHQQVERDQQAHVENNINQLYEELKSSVENRHWRKALACIQQFLQAYPDHPRATKIRQQIRVVQKNAEIEERHEQEERIRELITAKQYAEAADLSEDLLQRFPDSPQAAYLTELLPKLRERSMNNEPEDIIT